MQFLLSPESQEKCGWATHREVYQFVYLPFGLKNAGAYFSRAMSCILAGLEANCLAYLDDIVILDKDFPSHLASLRKVLYRFRLFNIKASDKAKFVWGTEQEESFLRLRECLSSKPCLAFPRHDEFYLHTDGSQAAVGAVLFQKQTQEGGPLVVVGYFSKALSDSQRKWSPTHIELFAIISALRFFRATIYGNHTTILSDHRPLTFLRKHNHTHDNLARWVVELQSYDVSIEYLKGSSNVIADALSRVTNSQVRFSDDSPESDDIMEFPVSINVCRPKIRSLRSPVVFAGSLVNIRPYDALVEQKSDPMCSAIMTLIETQKFPDHLSDAEKPALLSLSEKCTIRSNGCLYVSGASRASASRFERLVVPEKLREPIFLALHASPSAGGHFHWRKTLAKISRKYFWPHMAEDIFALVRSCVPCQRKRAQQMNRECLLPVISGAAFDKRHTRGDDDSRVYVGNLVSTLHAAWRAAAAYNERQSRKWASVRSVPLGFPRSESWRSRLFARLHAPPRAFSQAVQPLAGPISGHRDRSSAPHHYQRFVSSVPAHMNQVKRYFELSGPVFSFPWLPVEEGRALGAAQAAEQEVYKH
ncbi:hypothetical protein RB195_010166 [Necator americanus]|uniref:RNA-directed DNA polymerase n=1 Tax=Necator americanus TaxID=51031 RepID=A0ABR1D030_NECAM